MTSRTILSRTLAVLIAWLTCSCVFAQVERVWLTHKATEPSEIVVNWTTEEPGESVVRFGLTDSYGEEVKVAGDRKLHHVEITLGKTDAVYHYSVQTGDQTSDDAAFKACPTDELRVAIVADWQSKPDLSAVIKDDVHLLLTAGDNVTSIHGRCGAGNKDCITPYADLIDAYPDLFRSVPFLPVLGNHDKEIRPRGDQPPAEPVYDVEATAFRRFFELPDDEWKWHFDVPQFGVRFIALDLNHISDFGTTWQSCHSFKRGSAQYEWYREVMADADEPFVVTLYNEKNSTVRQLEGGSWGEMIRNGTLAITGFGYFAERAEVDGVPYYNTSLSGKGNRYPDPESKFLKRQNSYVLLTFSNGLDRVAVEIRALSGSVLDRQEYGPRPH